MRTSHPATLWMLLCVHTTTRMNELPLCSPYNLRLTLCIALWKQSFTAETWIYTYVPSVRPHGSSPVLQRGQLHNCFTRWGKMGTSLCSCTYTRPVTKFNWCWLVIFNKYRDRAVGIATGYVLDDWEIGVRIPVGLRIFCSPRHPDRL
jgi:hypothetical protein